MHKHLKTAAKLAYDHEFDEGLEYFLCAIIVKGGNILSVGFNKKSTNAFVEHFADMARGKRDYRPCKQAIMFDFKNICPRCNNEKTTSHTVCPYCSKQLRRCIKEHNGRARKNGYFGRVSTRSWVECLEKNNFSCSFCGKHHSKHSPIELDHIFPLHQGGFNIPDNTQPLCKVCHIPNIGK